MTRKLVSLVLALVMLLSMTAFSTASAEDKSGWIVDEAITLDVLVSYNSMCLVDWNEKEYYKTLGDETGIYMDFEVLNDWTNQVNMKIASNDMPDLLLETYNNVSQNREEFTELTDLINEYAPSLVKLFEQEPTVKSSILEEDGSIYGLPIHQTWYLDSALGGLMWINTEWLENVGMESPTNTQELYDVLCAFRDQDANGNGIVDDEVPFGFCESNWAGKIDDLFGCFGILNNVWSGYTQVDDDYNVIFQPVQPEYYNALEWLHKLYAEGLLDSEGFTQTSDQYHARISQNTYGCVINYNPVGMNDKFVPMNPILGENGTTLIDGDNRLSYAHQYISIPVGCEYAKEIVQLYEYVNSDIGRKMTCRYGEEGVSWSYADDEGNFILTDYNAAPPEGYEYMDQYIYTVGSGTAGLMFFSLEDWSHNVSELTIREKAISSYMPYFLKNRYRYVAIDEDTMTEMNMLLVELQAQTQNFWADAVINGVDETKWQRHLDICSQIGYERYVEIRQMQYNRFLGK